MASDQLQERWSTFSNRNAGPLTFLCLAAIYASGCAYTGSIRDYIHNGFKVGPEYQKPAAPVEQDWIDSYDKRLLQELPRDPRWWTVFHDPSLTNLINQSYEQNIPLREAGMRVVEARAQLGITVGALFPQEQSFYGDYRRSQISRRAVNSRPLLNLGIPRTFDHWATGFDAAWELDFWGKFRRAVESAEASLDATVEEYDDVLVTLLAETASAYVELRTAQERRRLAEANIESQQGSLNIARARYDSGTTDELDVYQALTNVRNTQALLPVLREQERKAEIRLCVLQGIPPRDLGDQLGSGPIPKASPTAAVGIPADLLRRRPDVRRAERLAAAESARIGVAAADLLPQFSIRGTINYAAEDFSHLLGSKSFAGDISPGFRWDLLNYGRLRNNVLVQDARFQQQALQYQQTVLRANADAERAIVTFLESQEQVKFLSDAVDANQQALKIAIDQYQAGETNYNQIFTLQAFLVDEQDALALAQQRVAMGLISIYKALGGGWQIRLGNDNLLGMPELIELPEAETSETDINLLPPIPLTDEEIDAA